MVAGAAVIFAAVIVAGVFLNLYMLAGSMILGPVFAFLGIPSEFVLTPMYVVCLFAGIVTSFFVMRPGWNAVVKKVARHKLADETVKEHVDDVRLSEK